LCEGHATQEKPTSEGTGVGVLAAAAVTFANGGDNIGVYVPVFVAVSPGGLVAFAVVFLILVAVWCLIEDESTA
jgi:cadmium resistance protein CadD (predicted permease)